MCQAYSVGQKALYTYGLQPVNRQTPQRNESLRLSCRRLAQSAFSRCYPGNQGWGPTKAGISCWFSVQLKDEWTVSETAWAHDFSFHD